MRRPFALRAEIVEHLRESGAEELAPDAVDEDARGQRILRRRPASSPDRAAWRAGRRCRACRGSRGWRAARSRRTRPSSCRAPESRVSARRRPPRTPSRAGWQCRTARQPARSFATSASSDCASGAAHWKCAATAVFCASVRLSSAISQRAAVRRPESPCPSPPSGHENSLGESASRKRPMVARRNSESCRMRTVSTVSAAVSSGCGEAQREIGLGGLVVRVDGPAGLRIAIDRARRQDIRWPDCSGWTCP